MNFSSTLFLFISACIFYLIFFPFFLHILTLTKNGVQQNRGQSLKHTLLRKIFFWNSRIVPKKYSEYCERLIQEASLSNKLSMNSLVLIHQLLIILIFLILGSIGGIKLIFSFKSLFIAISTGILIPIFYLFRKSRLRRESIIASIPFFADLLTLSCEAGLDIFASLLNIVQNSEQGPLNLALQNILKEVKFGISRKEALKKAYRQTDIWDLKTIYLTIIQAETLGTPVGQSLRNQIELMRQTRLNRAEKLAQETPVKLLFPLLIFIFPVTFVILLSPLVLRFIDGSFF